MKPIKFPEDESAHDCSIEWWYINGHLSDEDGNRYSFMDCLFKVKVKEVDIPFLSKIPLRVMYFSHSILSDITRKKVYPSINYVSTISKDSFTRPMLFVNYTDPIQFNGYVNSEIMETSLFRYRVKADNIDLNMESLKEPLLEGGDGYVNLGVKGSYYYSLTNLRTEGIIRIGDRNIRVTGKSWMDHQWADAKYSKDQWTWFSIQLDDDTELVCYEYDDEKRGACSKLASVSYKDGTQEHTENVKIHPLAKRWKSPKTGKTYELAWRIEMPEWDMSFDVEAMIDDQEMVFGTIHYWEGPLGVTGHLAGKPVSGQGFMELLGRPSLYSNVNVIKDSVVRMTKQYVSKGQSHLRNATEVIEGVLTHIP